jgi:hypothetical protein
MDSVSIHPRMQYPANKRKKLNVSKSPHPGKIAKLVKALEDHLKRHPNDGMSATRLAKLKV